MRCEDRRGLSSSLLMHTLQREVESLSDEVTRLRLMVHHIVKSSPVPPPSSPQPLASSSIDAATNPSVHACVAGVSDVGLQSPLESGKKEGSCSTQQPLVVQPEMMQLLEKLLAATRDATTASSALQKGRNIEGSKTVNRSSKLQQNNKRKKQRKRHKTSSSDSSYSDSSSSLSSASLGRGKKGKKKRVVCHQEKPRKEVQHHASRSSDGGSILLSDRCPCSAGDGNASVERQVGISKEKSSSSSHDPVVCHEKSERHSTEEVHAMPDDVASRFSASPNISCLRQGSYFGSLMEIIGERGSPDKTEQSFTATISSAQNKQERENESFYGDEHEHLCNSHETIQQGNRASETTNTAQVEEGGDSNKKKCSQFVPVGLSRVAPVQRRSLHSRLQDASTESSMSNSKMSNSKMSDSQTSNSKMSNSKMSNSQTSNSKMSNSKMSAATSALLLAPATGYSSAIDDEMIDMIFCSVHHRLTPTGNSSSEKVVDSTRRDLMSEQIRDSNSVSRNSVDSNVRYIGATTRSALSSPKLYRTSALYKF